METTTYKPDPRLEQYGDILKAAEYLEKGAVGLRLSRSGNTLVLSMASISMADLPLSARWIEAYEAIENHGFTVRNMFEEKGILQIVARKPGTVKVPA